jgi:1,4-dihydroxy-2-naphthoyl-CoA hydrolase
MTLELPEEIGGLDKMLGVEFVEASGDRVVLACDIRPDLHQPYGIVHGGVHCSLVESAASIGGALWFGDRGNVVGVANHTNFLRAAREGRLTATAEPVQRGRTQQLWRVTITDDADRNLAVGEVRLANIANAEVLGGG